MVSCHVRLIASAFTRSILPRAYFSKKARLGLPRCAGAPRLRGAGEKKKRRRTLASDFTDFGDRGDVLAGDGVGETDESGEAGQAGDAGDRITAVACIAYLGHARLNILSNRSSK